jgi:hypothetical protein
MKLDTRSVFPFLLLFLSAELPAQQVSFTNQANLLQPTFGFAFSNCAVDMNGDFLDDVVRVGSGALFFDYQQPGGSFLQKAIPLDVFAEPDWSICAGDLDRNGFNDLLFGNNNTVSFVLANDNGTAYIEFVAPVYVFSQRSTLADIDNDGDLDAFVCHDNGLNVPFRNDGNGNLTADYSLIPTGSNYGNYSAIWTDYDNDGDIDLYISKCVAATPPSEPGRINLLFQNNGDGSFSEVGALANLNDNAQSWTTAFEDFDNDGDMDAFLVNHDMKNRLFRNNGDGTFTDGIDASGIDAFDLGAWENAAADFNNDGFVDIFSELKKELYLGNGDLTFTPQDLPFSSGGIGDFNNDGFLDVVSGDSLWMNTGNGNNWLKVNTRGIVSNPNGIGARVEIHGDWGIQIREVRSGQSFYPMSSLTVHFGLGKAGNVDSLVVKWTSGIRTVVKNPPVNTTQNLPEVVCLLPPTQLQVNGSLAICPGETAEIIAPPGFSVAWSNGSAGQVLQTGVAGNYAAVLTDSLGCVSFSDTLTVSVIQEIPPVITANGKAVFCEGGAITLTSSPGANHTWSNGTTGQSIEVAVSGSYTVGVDAVCAAGQLVSEPFQVTVLDAPEPVVVDASIEQGGSLLLTAAGNGIHWYDQPAGGMPLGMGNTLQTPPLSATTTYYVASHTFYPGEIQAGGKPDTGGGGGLPTQPGWSVFDVWEPFTLLSVSVVVPQNAATGLRTVQLVDKNETVLAQAAFNLAPGQHELMLNFEVPTGENLSLRCPQSNLFRNSAGVQYPYPIGDVGSVKTSLFGSSYYYYFYHWKIQKESFECVSDRVPLTVTVTGTHDLEKQPELQIFPHPATDLVFVKMKNPGTGKALLQLFDGQGRRVLKKDFTPGEAPETLDVSQLPAGVYLLLLDSGGRLTGTRLSVE